MTLRKKRPPVEVPKPYTPGMFADDPAREATAARVTARHGLTSILTFFRRPGDWNTPEKKVCPRCKSNRFETHPHVEHHHLEKKRTYHHDAHECLRCSAVVIVWYFVDDQEVTPW